MKKWLRKIFNLDCECTICKPNKVYEEWAKILERYKLTLKK